MKKILEVDADLKAGYGGIKVHEGAAAINEKFKYWFEKINRGEVWGEPEKGNPLKKYQFRSPTDSTFALMEMEIATELPFNLPVRILAISCSPPTSRDRLTYVQIIYQSLDTNEVGLFQGDIVERKG